MTQTLELKVEQDHIESLAKVRNPIIAIEELIWNALDADASEIAVDVGFNSLGGLARIKVRDNGFGIRHDECETAFGRLGGSTKSEMKLTPGGRVPHGKLGKGRLRAFGIGHNVTWLSRYLDNGTVFQFGIKGQRTSLKRFEVGSAKEVVRKSTGVEVTIDGIESNFPSLSQSSRAAEELSKRLALYLRKYPGITICYDNLAVDPAIFERSSTSYPIRLQSQPGIESDAELTVIEWNTPTERALYFCDNNGFALEECPPGIQAPGFHFTAYLKSKFIPDLVNEGAFAVKDIHPEVASILDCARRTLKAHFRKREAIRAEKLVQQWQEEKVYPYEPSEQGPLKQVEREVFDVCAMRVHEYLPAFERTEIKSKRLTFRLLRQALESNPDTLQTILSKVLELPLEQQNELAAILGRTHLAAVINAAATVVNRLDFIGSLDSLLFGEFKKTLLERRQLHRILAEELWIFGEQYLLGVDDESLSKVLTKHIQILERDEIAPLTDGEITDLDGKKRVIDLMLYRQIPQLQQDSYEHLVIELKRPDCKLGQKEIGQIENYAFSVSDDERFDKHRTKWTFMLIGNELSPFAEKKCREHGRQYGHIHASDDGAVNIFVKKWSTIIAEAKWRYQFFKEKLELEVTTADGLRYLRKKHGEHFPSDLGDDQRDSR